MVKSSSNQKESSSISNLEVRVAENNNNNNNNNNSSSSVKYKGVRKRKWGKYVSEIRLPNSRERIWLGSYDTAEKAARAFDAALFCLRGPNAKFNFPDNPPEIPNGRSMSPAQIQVAATQYAHSDSGSRASAIPGQVDSILDSQSDSLSSCELLHHVGSPCTSVSGDEVTDIPFDNAFLDHFSTLGTENNVPNFGVFPEFDDFPGNFFTPHLPNVDYWPDNSEDLNSHSFNLWNF